MIVAIDLWFPVEWSRENPDLPVPFEVWMWWAYAHCLPKGMPA